jgi:hypothetical protein
MTFGYNANVFKDVVESKVVDHADSLLGGLLLKRARDPVIRLQYQLPQQVLTVLSNARYCSSRTRLVLWLKMYAARMTERKRAHIRI